MKSDIGASPKLVGLIAGLADNKLFLGRRYAEWCTGAPSLEAAVAAASMAQDEIGHARSLYPLLQDLAGKSEQTEPETRTQFEHVACLDHVFESWTDFVAANFLVDTALTILLESARTSSLEPLGQRARRMLEEERLHWLHAEGWTRRLAAASPRLKAALSSSMSVVAPDCLLVLGLAASELVKAETLDARASVLVNRFQKRIHPVLTFTGISLT
jgi:ring-1,2-phenylacetyl-CoA epoxidase subunit PaaC